MRKMTVVHVITTSRSVWKGLEGDKRAIRVAEIENQKACWTFVNKFCIRQNAVFGCQVSSDTRPTTREMKLWYASSTTTGLLFGWLKEQEQSRLSNQFLSSLQRR